jgi:hypothetical protein
MKLKKVKDRLFSVTGYAIEVTKQHGYMTVQTGPGYPYVVPEDYVCVTFNNETGDELYLLGPASMLVKEV